jgi:hypothetical protein
MKLTSEQRLDLGKLARKDIPKNLLMETFSVSRTTVWYWGKQDLRTRKDIPKLHHRKITIEIEAAILFMRTTFGYGCARIRQRLISAPSFELEQMEIQVQNFHLSRQAINEVLKKHGINGYNCETKTWKFFRASKPNELWQLDLKEFKFQGRKYYIFVCVDDYSRFILTLSLFDHCPKTEELTSVLQTLKIKSEKILADNGGQFREQWKDWCRENNIKAIFAHPYYPQDKGKVERSIRNLTEEFVDLLNKFPLWISRLEEFRIWFNEKRFHLGVKDYPANLYVKL